MSKFTRGQLKDLIKECLVEILAEGLASSSRLAESSSTKPTEQSRSSSVSRRAQPPIPPRSSSSALSSVVFGAVDRGQRPPTTENRRPAVSPAADTISSVTSDPVMSQIFADTAATTLMEQIQAESGRPGSASGDELVGNPDEIFGGSQHWAALAFSESPKRQ